MTIKIDMKNLLITLIAALLVFMTSIQVNAEEDKTLSFTANYNENILNIEIVEAALRRIGYNLEITSAGTANALSVASAEADGIISFIDWLPPYSSGSLVRVPVSIADLSYAPIVREDSTLHFDGWADAKGLRVTVNGQWSAVNHNLESVATADILEEADMDTMFSLLKTGEADVIFVPVISGTSLAVDEGLKELPHIGHTEVYPYLNKKNASLLSDLTMALQSLKDSGQITEIQESNKKTNTDGRKHILHISSYYPDMNYERRFAEAIENFFGDRTAYSLNNISLNSKRLSVNSRIDIFCDAVFNTYSDYRPDIIIATDDAALDMILEFHNSMFRNVPVVFYAVGDESEKEDVENFPGDIYGYFEEIPAEDALDQMLALYPDTEGIYVINDYKDAGLNWKTAIQKQFEPYKEQLDISYNENLTFHDLLTHVRQLPRNTLILEGVYFTDAADAFIGGREAAESISDTANSPMFTLFPTSMGYGAVAGFAVEPETKAGLVTELAQDVLQGADIDSPIADVSPDTRYFPIYDYSVLSDFNMLSANLPERAVIINKPPDFIAAHPIAFVAALSLSVIAVTMAVFLYVLFRQNRKLRAIQKTLHTTEELRQKDVLLSEVKARLEATIETAPVAYVMSVDNIVQELNDYAKSLGFRFGNPAMEAYVDINERVKIIERFARSDRLFNEVARFEIPSGDVHRFNINLVRVKHENKNASVLWGIDIEASEKQKDSIRRFGEDMQSLIDIMPTPMLICKPEGGEVLYANRALLNLFGIISLSPGRPLHIRDFYSKKQGSFDTYLEEGLRIVQEVRRTGGFITRDWFCKTADGREIEIVITVCVASFMAKESLLILINNVKTEAVQTEEAPRPVATSYPNARVILCEDNVTNQEIIKTLLSFFDINPIIAGNGKVCLSILEKTEVDLILMDIMMPEMDGYETTMNIRNSGKPYATLPIVAMTASVLPEDIENCYNAGMNEYLKKPVDLNELKWQLYRYLCR